MSIVILRNWPTGHDGSFIGWLLSGGVLSLFAGVAGICLEVAGVLDRREQDRLHRQRASTTVSWQEDHKKRVAAFPIDVQAAHTHSSGHRREIVGSTQCGCFFCCTTFPPSDIVEWVDEVGDEGQTALCPNCGIDSVVGDRSGFDISEKFLSTMKAHWFRGM